MNIPFPTLPAADAVDGAPEAELLMVSVKQRELPLKLSTCICNCYNLLASLGKLSGSEYSLYNLMLAVQCQMYRCAHVYA